MDTRLSMESYVVEVKPIRPMSRTDSPTPKNAAASHGFVLSHLVIIFTCDGSNPTRYKLKPDL